MCTFLMPEILENFAVRNYRKWPAETALRKNSGGCRLDNVFGKTTGSHISAYETQCLPKAPFWLVPWEKIEMRLSILLQMAFIQNVFLHESVL